jgi:diaminopimelate epimerase
MRLICHGTRGVGADGILLGPLPDGEAGYALRIFNPDGSETETSGNGVRIFARWLVDEGISDDLSFTVRPPGGPHFCEVSADGRSVKATMQKVTFDSALIPVAGPRREVLRETIVIEDCVLTYCAASTGNPHCVVLDENPTPQLARHLGPLIERDARFPRRTNVQFMEVLDRANIRIEIWERGAGYTLSSGSSSTAAAAVAHQLGLCDELITVQMPGGRLTVQFDEVLIPSISGPVVRVCHGKIAAEMFADIL